MTAGRRGPLAIEKAAGVRRALLAWHRTNGLRAPWRESRDPYACLVAAVMAQQTQMSRVMPSFERFMAAFPTLDALAEASLGEAIRVWAGMGYNMRAVRLHRAARAIAAGGWPREAAALSRIHGIGPFTAAIIASFAFGEPAACVDTNVRRVLTRLAGDETMSAAALQDLADATISRSAPDRWNQALMDYGARVCTPRPRCGECVVARRCASRERYAPGAAVAEQRAKYGSGPRRAQDREVFETSPRYYRGRIIDLLRATAPGGSLSLSRLPALLRNGHGQPDQAAVRLLVERLQRDGLLVVRRGRVRLPDERKRPRDRR